jgi:hypothetical protein
VAGLERGVLPIGLWSILITLSRSKPSIFYGLGFDAIKIIGIQNRVERFIN